MKKKGNFRKVVSGLLAGMTMLSTVLSPMTAYAAEIQPEEKPPLYEEVKDLLDEDEVVTAKDYEIETGSVFDVKSDYTGLEIKDDNKVKVTFEEAKNDKNEDFTTDHVDTYKAVYYVEPVNQEHPKYQISRKLIVREKETEVQTEAAGSEAVTESETAGSEQQTEEAEESESDSEITDIGADEFDDLVEQAQNQDTYDEESGLELHDVLEQAGDEGVDLDAMEEGEIATFEAVSAYSARSTQQVTIEKGPLYRYADYNLGTYLTEPYYISYGNVRAIAYCVQPAKPGPGSGNYTITKIGDNQALAKVCYYGTDAAGSESFFANKHTDFSEGKRFIIIHMAASYANGSSDAFYGTNATGEALAKELYNYCVNKPEIPDVAMSFSKPDVKAYVDRNVQRTENIKFNASSQQKITMDLPKGVKLHNVSTGTVSAAGASVTIGGGTTFYLSAPLTQTRDVTGNSGDYLQLSLFPTEEEQLGEIRKAVAALEQPAAFLISDEVVDDILRTGSGQKNTLFHITARLIEGLDNEEMQNFLKEEYETGGKGFTIDGQKISIWYDNDGIRIRRGDSARRNFDRMVTWEEAADRIRDMYEDRSYVDNLISNNAIEQEQEEMTNLLALHFRDTSRNREEQQSYSDWQDVVREAWTDSAEADAIAHRFEWLQKDI